jgi:hypothetical protein
VRKALALAFLAILIGPAPAWITNESDGDLLAGRPVFIIRPTLE